MNVTVAEIKRSGIPDALVQTLANGNACSVGSCNLYPDDDLQLIWGCDPYGLDFVAVSNWDVGDVAAALAAIKRAVEVDEGDNLHDRMYPYPFDETTDTAVL